MVSELPQTPYTRLSVQIEMCGTTILGVLNSGDRKLLSKLLDALNSGFASADAAQVESTWAQLGPILSKMANRYEAHKGHFFALRKAYAAFRAELSNQAPTVAPVQEPAEVLPVRAKMGGRVAVTLNS